MNISEYCRDYPCEDYFLSTLSEDGYWDEDNQVWCIEPLERIEENVEDEFLQVGRPGVDGIGFGYRQQQPGFWASNPIEPIEQRFQYLAPTVQEFLSGWMSGQITI